MLALHSSPHCCPLFDASALSSTACACTEALAQLAQLSQAHHLEVLRDDINFLGGSCSQAACEELCCI